MDGFIYKISNSINDKVYIGKTLSTIEKRFQEHIKDAYRETDNVRPLYRAIRKYGADVFHVELIEQISIENLSDREKYWIQYYDSYNNGYNATVGGDGKQLYDYDAIIKGFQSGKLIRELATEFECCVDTIAQALKLANIDSTINKNKRAKKSISAYNLQNELIKTFSSCREASEWLYDNQYTTSQNWDNITAAIGRVANGQRKSAYGFMWKHS